MEKTILIIDDDRDLVDFLVKSFQAEGFTCFTAYSADEAVEAFNQNPCSVVLTDIVMPGDNDGLDLIREIKDINPAVQLFAMSGNAADADGESLLDFAEVFGADKIFQKPFSIKDLLSVLN